MSTELFFPDRTNQQRLRVGPLTCDIDGFAAQLAVEGYAHSSAKEKLRLFSDLSRWLEHEGLGVEVLDEQRIERFLAARGPRRTAQREATTGRQLLSYLRENKRISAAPSGLSSDSPMARIERAYERFLVHERGLTSATVTNYLPTVHAFLSERFGTEVVQLERLVAQDANRFILRHAQRLSRARAKLLVTALRSFLRFLYQRGDIPTDLANAVLPVMHWRLS